MENRYVAIYSTVLFPNAWGGTPEDWEREGLIVNHEVSSIEEAEEFFRKAIEEKGQYNVYNTHIYDKVTEEYI